MNFFVNLTTPVFVFFLIVIIGTVIGKIKIYNFSFDLSAILIVAIIAGYAMSVFSVDKYNEIESYLDLFSKFGTAVFISSVGLSTGISAKRIFTKEYIMYFFSGVAMVCIGFVTMMIVYKLDNNIEYSIIVGVLCGAMTSTAGLSAACESTKVIPELAVLGYGCSYFLGVIAIVMFVQIFLNHKSCECDKRIIDSYYTDSNKESDVLLPIGISIILGYILGNIEIPGLNFSLGSSGGILCSAFFVGIILEKINAEIGCFRNYLSAYRNFGLIMFFVGTGISAGAKLNMSLNIVWFLYGGIIAFTPIFLGYLSSVFIFNRNKNEMLCAVAGGMTSTPAIGIILKKSKDPINLSLYSVTYMGALLTMVIGMRFI